MPTKKRQSRRGGERSVLKLVALPALVTAIVVAFLYGILSLVDARFLSGSSSVILFASFGSSAFLLFMAPHSRTSRPDKFVKSYVIATALGSAGYLLIGYIPLFAVTGIMIFLICMLLYATRSEHPPAIGIMLAFILFRIDIYGILIVASGIVLLWAIRMALERYIYEIDSEIESMERLQ